MRVGAKRRIAVFLKVLSVFTAGGLGYGALVGRSLYPEVPLLGPTYGALAGAIAGFSVSTVVGGGEILFPLTPLGRQLERLPFAIAFAIKSFVYSVAILLIVGSKANRWLAAYALIGPEAAREATQRPGQTSVALIFILAAFLVLLIQVARIVGPRALNDIWLGRYHRPRTEERFFLFVDVVGSTSVAERLGPVGNHQFLRRVFELASDPIDENRGDIYQHVGDEVVITWTLRDGAGDARPIACFIAIRKALSGAAVSFERDFGAVPQLRGALHAGEVLTGEVGGSRRSLVYHGDVLNTASRIEGKTRDLNRSFLVSQEALDRLDGKGRYKLEDMGAHELRGRAAPVHLYALDCP